MESSESIPPEIRASVEADALFGALRRGDYASAAKSQERLKGLGWHLSREAPRPKPARRTDRPRPPEATMARKVDRFVQRGAHCCLCHRWPAPVDFWVEGRIMLTCRICATRPDTRVRLEEIAEIEWAGTTA
jgi:hypothetical protein